MRFDAARAPPGARWSWATPPEHPPAPCVTVSCSPILPPATPNAYEGSSSTTETALNVVGQANYIYAMYPIADCGSSFEKMRPGSSKPITVTKIPWRSSTSVGMRASTRRAALARSFVSRRSRALPNSLTRAPNLRVGVSGSPGRGHPLRVAKDLRLRCFS